MAAPGPRGTDDAPALAYLLDQAEQRLARDGTVTPEADRYVFAGNRHESVPRRLLLDRRLTPLERNAWQVFRLLLDDDGITAFPTYDELRPYLTAMPGAAQASHETIARVLTVLRLTRWLSLARRRRERRTGRVQGNLYVLHDEPLTPYEALQLDPTYLILVSHALTHAAKAVQVVGVHALQEIADDPMLSGRTLPTRLQVLAQRLAGQSWNSPDGDAHGIMPDDAGADRQARPDDAGPPSSDSEARRGALLRNPKTARTVRTEAPCNEVRNVPRARETLRLPQRFRALKNEQQAGALVALGQVEATLQQAVLDEWDARCEAGGIRNPAGYLFGVIQKAIKGEFRAWAAAPFEADPTSAPAPAADPPAPPADPALVQAHLARLRALLRDA